MYEIQNPWEWTFKSFGNCKNYYVSFNNSLKNGNRCPSGVWYKQNKTFLDMHSLCQSVSCDPIAHYVAIAACTSCLSSYLSIIWMKPVEPHSILHISSPFEPHWLRAGLANVYSRCWESWRPFSSSTASALLIHNSVVPWVTPYSQGHSVGGSVSSHSLSLLSIFNQHLSSDTRTGQIQY